MRNTTNDFTDAELGTLSIKVRNLLMACVCNGNSYKEVAAQNGIPEGTVKSRINRARAKIAALREAASAGDMVIAPDSQPAP